MRVENYSQGGAARDYSPHPFEVVAAVLSHGNQVALFQRSENVQNDNGLWHCITGFLSAPDTALDQVKTEIYEEANVGSSSLKFINSSILYLKDAKDRMWKVHAFHYESMTRELGLNWENDAVQWLELSQIDENSTVNWLENVISSLGIKNYFDRLPG